MKFLIFPILMFSALSANVFGATNIYVTIEGAKQGKFKGENPNDPASKIEGTAFNYEVDSPRDAATGLAAGKRQYSPITIVKELDASSPQLFQALVTNEVLKSVLIEFARPTPQGGEEIYETIQLANAAVSDFKQDTSSAALPVEEVSFTFQKIVITNVASKTMAADDWTALQ
jgi:type VI secretion system secreted protein Hcp